MMRVGAPKLIILLLALAAGSTVAQAQCNLPLWSSWKQADLSIDPQPRELAIESLKDYLAGLEQASTDFKCSSKEWNGDRLEIKSACFEPTATNGKYQYAVSFSYSVQCRVTDIVVDVDGQDKSEDTPVTLSGNVDGVMEAKRVPVGILNADPGVSDSPIPAQEPAVEAADGPGVPFSVPSTSTRITIIFLSTCLVSGQATQNATLPGLPYPDDAIGVMAVSVAELRNGLCITGAPPLPVAELTISEAHAAFANGTLTCSSLVNAYLQRISAFDARTGLNAIVSLNPDAQNEAQKFDILLEQASILSNSSAAPVAAAAAASSSSTQLLKLYQKYPLFCIPLLVKDNFDVQGMPTTAGSIALAQNYPQTDAAVVERLKSAGAVILAKSSLGELALFPAYSVSSLPPGVVRNPYHLGYTPSGSSGGSAAGIAAGFAVAAIGSDTGNSVRGPASHCSLVGLRPSIGLVGRSGMIPLRFDRDTAGPLTRSVEDNARLLTVMQGFDPGDNITHILSTNDIRNFSHVENLSKNGLKGAKIGVLAGLENLPKPDKEMFFLFTKALEDLEAAGATIIPNFTISGNSLGTRDWDVNRDGEGPALGQWFAGGKWRDLWKCSWTLRAGFDQYLESSTRGGDGNSNNTTYDNGYIPNSTYNTNVSINNTSFNKSTTTPSMVPIKNLRQLFEKGLYHPAAYQELKLAVEDPVALSSPDQSPCQCGTLEDDICRVEFRQNLLKSMDHGQIDVIVYPTWSRPPLRIGNKGDGYYDGNNSPMIAPHVGAPAITVPMGFFGDAKLPAGLQFLARPFQEAKLLEIAYAYEHFSKHRRPPPLFAECKDPVQVESGDFEAAAG